MDFRPALQDVDLVDGVDAALQMDAQTTELLATYRATMFRRKAERHAFRAPERKDSSALESNHAPSGVLGRWRGGIHSG